MNKSNQKTKSNAVWNLFRSVKLTILILIIMAIASIAGTIIPQVPQQESYEFASRLSPGMFRVFSALNLFDMYHSMWFQFLMTCLGINLIVCSIDRFPGTWKLYTSQPKPDRRKPFENIPQEQTFFVKGTINDTTNQVDQLLNKRYRKTRTKKNTDEHFFYSEKGGYSRFGVYLVHFSILLILIGGLTGSNFGFEAFVNILENEKTDIVNLRNKTNHSLKLDFEVRCDKFKVDFYENGAPKEYRSELTFIVDGKDVEKTSLLVNHPAQFMGVTFYQSTYGSVPGSTVHLDISRDGKEQNAEHFEIELKKAIELPGNDGHFSVIAVKTDFMHVCPAVQISIKSKDGKKHSFWVFQDYKKMKGLLPEQMLKSPKFNPSAFAPYTFFLKGLETSYYTGLQVNRDPGVPIVWAGCFLIIAGFIITFFTSHMRIWVRISKEKQGIKISVAGTTNRHPVVLERELLRLTNNLRDLTGEQEIC